MNGLFDKLVESVEVAYAVRHFKELLGTIDRDGAVLYEPFEGECRRAACDALAPMLDVLAARMATLNREIEDGYGVTPWVVSGIVSLVGLPAVAMLLEPQGYSTCPERLHEDSRVMGALRDIVTVAFDVWQETGDFIGVEDVITTH